MMEEAFLWAEIYSENYSMGVTTYGNSRMEKQTITRGGFWCQILQPRDQCPKLPIEVICPRH